MALCTDLREFEYRNDLRKGEVAALLGVQPPRYSKIRDPRQRARLNASEVSAIAKLLNRSVSYVRRLYSLPVSYKKGKARRDPN